MGTSALRGENHKLNENMRVTERSVKMEWASPINGDIYKREAGNLASVWRQSLGWCTLRSRHVKTRMTWGPAGNECGSTCCGTYICSRQRLRCPVGGCIWPSRLVQRRGTSFVGTFVCKLEVLLYNKLVELQVLVREIAEKKDIQITYIYATFMIIAC